MIDNWSFRRSSEVSSLGEEVGEDWMQCCGHEKGRLRGNALIREGLSAISNTKTVHCEGGQANTMTMARYKSIGEPGLWGGGSVSELVGRVRGGARRICISGLEGSALAFVASRLLDALDSRPFLVVTADHKRAVQLYEDLLFYAGQKEGKGKARVLYYPADEVLPYSEMLPDRGAVQRRLGGLLHLKESNFPVLVMSAAALARRVLPKKELSERSDILIIGEEVDRDVFVTNLVEGGFRRVSVVEDRGTFSVRGGMIDLFSPLYRYPLRVEWDDLIVESIRFFDPHDQRTLEEVEELLVGPVDETLCNARTLRCARRKFATLADELSFPTRELNQLHDDLANGLRPFGLQALMPGLFEELETLFDYLPPETMVLLDEPRDIRLELQRYQEKMQTAYEGSVKEGRLVCSPEAFLLSLEELEKGIRGVHRVEHESVLLLEEKESSSDKEEPEESEILSQAAESSEKDGSREELEGQGGNGGKGVSIEENEDVEAASIHLAEGSDAPAKHRKEEAKVVGDIPTKPLAKTASWGSAGELVLPFATRGQLALKQALRAIPMTQDHRLQPLVEALGEWHKHGMKCVVVCGARGQALRLRELLNLYDIRSKIWDHEFQHNVEQLGRGVQVDLFLGRIAQGFLFPRAKLAVLSEEDIFGPKVRRRKSKKKGTLKQGELHHLQVGDLVIHRQHGLANYGGLHTVTIDGVTADFLLLQYLGKDKLYLPVTRLGLVERYTSGGSPKVDRLKGTSFEKKKSKAKQAIQVMAGELLQLYAQRQAHLRDSYENPGEMFQQFEASFPFQETVDQLNAIQDILENFHSPRVMDRLICGDVGYGKTEVAMRAAFYAAFNGKQVAVLVPTTVLAQQHGLTFTERFEGYPVKIGVMSRFQTKKEQKDVAERIKSGDIDIVVGTHRLLSRDVQFKELGLLIVDEEHRFGVRHKERIKQLKKLVDVLTLTATPIPRTLELAMMGVRDISLITTPPHDRLAIRTSIAPFGDQVIREAIMRELNRGGQVFFLHNRVETIGKRQAYLSNLIPEARVLVAHGQMAEGELERVMLDFIQGRYNILLCTSIIESGLDIPRANTILVERADTFGLAQLYQIRGRVGRGRERAYAVLLVPANKRVTPEAKQRLATLQRFTELGAGFEIARHDLELRGAGNLLGKQQSGHANAIGMELYLEMLEEAVAELQGKPFHHRIEPEVKLGMDAYIPEHYIPDVQLRLQCYRRLASAETAQELDELSEEFADRFGMLPTEVEVLFQMMEIKQLLVELFVVNGKRSGSKFRIFFHQEAPLNPERIFQLAQEKEPPFRLLPKNGLECTEPLPEGRDDCLSAIRQFLRPLPELILRQEGAAS